MSDLIIRELLVKEIVNRPTEQSGYNPVYLNGCATRQNEIIDIINDMPSVEAVPKSYAEQIRWERDVAVGQLNEIGCQFGQKMDEVKKKLEVLQWIPCSERLPEEPKENPIFGYKRVELYLISVKNADYPFRAFWNGKIFTDGFGKVDAIAWMPLPEPYKGE